jgi:hypothetical protein
MSLVFDGTDIPGLHGAPVFGSWEVKRREVQFFQIRGAGEIAGEYGPRTISVLVLLHDNYDTVAKLLTKLDELSDLIGINSTLEEEGNIEREFDYCTFLGWEPVPLNGQESPGPLYNIAGTLDVDQDDDPVGGWFQQIMLHFRQLRK